MAYTALAVVSHSASRPPLTVFFALLSVAAAVWIAAWLYLRDRSSTPTVIFVCFGAAILFRLAGFGGAPLYEDDFYRYMWDGYIFATTGNPYGVAPASYFGAEGLPERFDDILSQVNYPDIPTIYGPVLEVSFLLAYLIAPGEIWPLKLLFLSADLLVTVVVWRMTRNAAALVLYAWAPLVIKEVAFTAHPDVVLALFALAAVWQRTQLRMVAAGALLGLAAAAKLTALVIVPILLMKQRNEPEVAFGARARAMAAMIAVVALSYLPFVLQGRFDMAGLRVFASEWEFNSFFYAVLKSAFGAGSAALLSPTLFVVSCAAIWRWRRNSFRPAVLLLLLFAFSPVVNPWYVLALAPFVAIEGSWWGVIALTTVLFSYATGQNLGLQGVGQFDHPWWVRPAEVIPVLLAAAYERRRQHLRVY